MAKSKKSEIWISPSIQMDKILENKEEIYQAAKPFRKDGIRLMKLLGEAYQINPFEGRELFDLKRKSSQSFKSTWRYGYIAENR